MINEIEQSVSEIENELENYSLDKELIAGHADMVVLNEIFEAAGGVNGIRDRILLIPR